MVNISCYFRYFYLDYRSSHLIIYIAGIFLKEFNDELQKIFSNNGEKCRRPVFALPPCGSSVKHDKSATSAAHLLEKYRVINVICFGGFCNRLNNRVIGF